MPKPGYKSITVSEHVYKKFFNVYEENKRGLEIKGIRSFSGYLTSMMEEMDNTIIKRGSINRA
jgi:hypothetical protein